MIIVKKGTFDSGYPKRLRALCDECGKLVDMKKHGGYNRYVVIHEKNETKTVLTYVPRYRCCVCSKTHVALSENIIPYSSYDQSMKKKVVSDYYRGIYTVEKLCEIYQISVDLLYTWIKE